MFRFRKCRRSHHLVHIFIFFPNVWEGDAPSHTHLLRTLILPSGTPLLEYSSPVWSPTPNQTYKKREMVQRRAARWTLCRFFSYDSVSDMLGDLGWRSLEDRRTDSRLRLFYKIVHGLVAVPLPPYVVHTQVFTRHSASHPLAFRQIHTVADYYKYSFFPLAIFQ